MSDADGLSYAPPHSLRGLLQRGRGMAAMRAAAAPAEVAPHVEEVLRRDFRWDFVDDRAPYLARLIRDLELSPAPVVELLAGSERDCERATEVLELLALAGSDEARDALRTHIREGAHWVLVLESVSGRWPSDWWADLGDVARTRIGAEAERPWLPEPWTRFGIEVSPPVRRPSRPDLSGWEEPDLLAHLADPRADDGHKITVLRELARRTPTEALLPLVPSLGRRDGRGALPRLARVVRGLGDLAVPAARRWATDERTWLAALGREVLADHLGPEIIPDLVAELTEQWGARAWCGPGLTARRLARFGPEAAEAAPLLRRFWLSTPHSYERTDYLAALAAIDPSGLDRAHAESLWDCEERARLLGVAHAPDMPWLLDRIAALRDDPMETPEVAAAAAARLAESQASA